MKCVTTAQNKEQNITSISEVSVDLSPAKLPSLLARETASKFCINHSPAFLYNLPTTYASLRV